MYPYVHRDKFYHDVKDERTIMIITGLPDEDPENPLVLTNEDLYEEGYELYEAIMDSESFSFQNCISSYVKFKTIYITQPIKDCYISIYKIINNDVQNPIPIGKFWADSDASYITQDGKFQDILAYDDLDSVINCDPKAVTALYNDLQFPVTIKNMRDYILGQLGIEVEETALICDDILVPRQISEEDLISGQDILKCIAEINGVFPHIGKDGILHWISLDVGGIHDVGLYPSSTTYPGETTYPSPGYSGTFVNIYRNYLKQGSTIYANYETQKPDGIQIRNENNETAYFLNQANSINPYTIIGNFLCYSLTQGQYQIIAERLYKKIRNICYVPFQSVKMADPCLEVGDRICVHTEEGTEILTYIFSKHTNNLAVSFEDIIANGTYWLPQYDKNSNATSAKLKNLDQRMGNVEKSGSGPLQIMSVAELPASPQLNVLYLIQGTFEES